MLDEIIGDSLLIANAVFGIYPANSVGDDIYVYESEERTTPKAIFYGLRQQAEIESQKFYQCISDFIAPRDTGKQDYIGMFAVSTGFGCDELCSK